MNVTRGSKLINDKHERNYDTRSLRFHLSMELSVKRSGGKQEASSRMWQKRTSWRRHSNSRERNWHSRLNGNRRWFVRQNSFSGSPGGIFQGSCRARRDAPCSSIFQLASTFWTLSYTRSFLLSLSSLCPFRDYSTYERTRRTPPPSHAKRASGIVFKIRFPR